MSGNRTGRVVICLLLFVTKGIACSSRLKAIANSNAHRNTLRMTKAITVQVSDTTMLNKEPLLVNKNVFLFDHR
jgi:hypothetical protein